MAIDRVPAERDDVAAYTLDLADEGAVAGALADAAGRGLAIQHVVAIAGGALPEEKTGADVADLPLEVFRASLELNLVTAWITLRAALPHLRRADGDRSVTLTTSTDALASYGLPAYAAAKAGLIGLVDSLAGPLGGDGIRINAVAPGDVPTTATCVSGATSRAGTTACGRARRSGGWARPRTSRPRTSR